MTIGTLKNSATQTAADLSSQTVTASSSLKGFAATPPDMHPALEEVRRLKEFQPPTPSPLEEWLKQNPWIKQLTKTFGDTFEQLINSLKKLLGSLHPEGIPSLPQNIRDIFSGLSGFLIALVGLYAFYLLLTFLLHFQEKKKNALPLPIRVFEETLLVNSDHHFRQSMEAAQENLYDRGIRELYLATLCLLDESRLVPYTAARTNQEYGQQIQESAKPNTLVNFITVASKFEMTHYGGRAANATLFSTSQKAFQSLKTGLSVPHA